MKKQLKTILSLGLALLSTGLILSGCDQTSDSTQQKTYKIGAIFSVTGRASFLGDPEKKTAEMVVEKINAAGGINGTPLELIVMDSQGEATKATLAARKLITQENVLALIGPSTSGNTLAIIPLAEKYETPLISCAASSQIVRNKAGKTYPWVFKTAQSDSLGVEAIYSHLQSRGMKKVAIMSVTSGFGASGRTELLRLASTYGIEVVADEKYGPKDTDMTVQLAKIKALSPQAIINWSVGPTQITVVKNWKALDMNNSIKMYQSHGFGSLKNIELAAGAAEGVYLPLGALNIATLLKDDHVQKTVTNDYLNDYQKTYNEPLSSFGGHAWDAVNLLARAIKIAGADRTKIRAELEKTKNFIGQHGVFNFSANDHNGLDKSAFTMLVVKNGQWAFAD